MVLVYQKSVLYSCEVRWDSPSPLALSVTVYDPEDMFHNPNGFAGSEKQGEEGGGAWIIWQGQSDIEGAETRSLHC